MADYTIVADLLKSVTAAAWKCLEASPDGSPEHMITPHAVVYDDCCNFVGTFIEFGEATTSETWPTEMVAERVYCECVNYSPTIVVSLRRPCQPVLGQSSFNPFPVPSKITAAGQNLAIDYMILTCELPHIVQALVAQRQVEEGTELHEGDVYGVIPGRITPHLIGDCGGWDMRFKLEVVCCRDKAGGLSEETPQDAVIEP